MPEELFRKAMDPHDPALEAGYEVAAEARLACQGLPSAVAPREPASPVIGTVQKSMAAPG
jgi:hypothetical protein